MAACFVELGSDPFRPRREGQESSFQRGIFLWEKRFYSFLNACLERLPDDLSSFGDGFKELRIALELGNADQ
jgi:hypothetical protein